MLSSRYTLANTLEWFFFRLQYPEENFLITGVIQQGSSIILSFVFHLEKAHYIPERAFYSRWHPSFSRMARFVFLESFASLKPFNLSLLEVLFQSHDVLQMLFYV